MKSFRPIGYPMPIIAALSLIFTLSLASNARAASQYHPADINNDSHIDLANDNVNNYFLCWRTGCNWALTNPSNPGPGPTDPAFQSYMQSAAFIWKSGEAYYYDSTQACPQCYVPGVGTASTWAEGFGGSGAELGQAEVVDGSGNIIIAGTFSSTVDFDPAHQNASGILTSTGTYQPFVAKYTGAGALLWATAFGDVGERITSMAADSSGNIWVSGIFGTYSLAKFSPAGVLVWTGGPVPLVSTYGASLDSIAADSQGNLLATGKFFASYGNPLSFGSGISIYSPYSSENAFLAKFSPSGAVVWAKDFNNYGDIQYGTGVATDAAGNIFVSGTAFGVIDLGGGFLKNNNNVAGYDDAFGFLGKFSPTGSYIWGRRVGTDLAADGPSPWARVMAMSLDGAGNVILGGDFSLHSDLGGESMDSGDAFISGTSPVFDHFIATYAGTTGTYQWSQTLTSNYGSGSVETITSDPQNDVLVSGSIHTGISNTIFNYAGAQLSIPYNTADGFVAKYSSNGTPLWARQFYSPQATVTVRSDSAGYPLILGSYSGTITVNGKVFTSNGGTDLIFGRIQQ